MLTIDYEILVCETNPASHFAAQDMYLMIQQAAGCSVFLWDFKNLALHAATLQCVH